MRAAECGDPVVMLGGAGNISKGKSHEINRDFDVTDVLMRRIITCKRVCTQFFRPQLPSRCNN